MDRGLRPDLPGHRDRQLQRRRRRWQSSAL